MLTLTKGEKLQSLLESVEKQRKFGASESGKLSATTSIETNVGAQSIRIQEATNDSNKTATAGVNSMPLVKLFEKMDNNNLPEEHLSPPLTPDIKQANVELNIVEQNADAENGQSVEDSANNDVAGGRSERTCSSTELGQPISDNVVDSTRTSVSAMSIESDKYSDVDTSPQQPIDNNNSLADSNEVIVTPTEEPIGTSTGTTVAAATASTEKRTKIIEGIEEATEATIDAQLDINENKTESDAAKTDISIDNVMDNNTINDNVNATSVTESAAAATESADKSKESINDSTTKLPVNDLDEKVQIVEKSTVGQAEEKGREKKGNDAVEPVENIELSASTPIQVHPNHNEDNEDDDNMSPLLNARQPLNSPRLIKSKDIMSELPLTPDSSHSLDSEYSTSFEMKPFNPAHIPERSFSSESLNSETSNDSNDSKSSIKLTEAKFSKNGTLERQISNGAPLPTPSSTSATGLQVLMLWNNRITRNASQSVSDLLAATTTLEILNVGRNVLSNEFISNIKNSLKTNTSLTSLGLQSAHLSSDGVKTLAELLNFGGNVTLQRIDLRDNNLQVSGLTALNEVLKSNKSVTRIDLDDVPRRHHVSIICCVLSQYCNCHHNVNQFQDHGSDSSIDYSRVVNNIRSLCARNENPPEPEPVRTSVKRVRNNFLNSRKISLTCQSIRNPVLEASTAKAERHLLDPTRKSGGRLRSPLPSPIPSPVSSPIPSPSRSRFQVSRVTEPGSSPITPPSSNSCSPTSFTTHSRFRVTVVEAPKPISAPVNIVTSTTKEPKITTEHINVKVPSKPTEPIITSLSVIDSIGNNSFDSPDLEVKAYMDDSCSSFSSLDSIDRGNDLNTSMSSMESYEILGEAKATDTLTTTTVTRPKPITIGSKTLSNSSIDSASSNKAESSSSSLEASTCSNDSIYGSQELPILKISSNEGTLTNSPSSPCSGETTAQEKDSLGKPEDKRLRKTSWIGKSDGVYPATLDKLMSIFQHPSNLFFNNRSEPVKKESAPNQENKPPSRKESPMGGLFAWSKKENSPDDAEIKPIAEPITSKAIKSPLQPNVSPENTITSEDADILTVDTIPVKLKREMKENISPEHTVTATSVANLQSQSAHSSAVEPPHDKVRFEVGGNDDDDDDDNDDGNTSESIVEDSVRGVLPSARGSSPVRHPHLGAVGKTLGQITRDSLSILKGSSNNSQDSIRSLESLSEIVFEEPQQ